VFLGANICACHNFEHIYFTFILLQTLLTKKPSSMHECESIGASHNQFFELSARGDNQSLDDDLPASVQVSLSNANLELQQIFDNGHLFADRNLYRNISS
jgi:hypothetical protein